MINCRRDVHYSYAGIQAQLWVMHLDNPERLPKETMPTPESMVKDGWAKRCPNHPGQFIAGDDKWVKAGKRES